MPPSWGSIVDEKKPVKPPENCRRCGRAWVTPNETATLSLPTSQAVTASSYSRRPTRDGPGSCDPGRRSAPGSAWTLVGRPLRVTTVIVTLSRGVRGCRPRQGSRRRQHVCGVRPRRGSFVDRAVSAWQQRWQQQPRTDPDRRADIERLACSEWNAADARGRYRRDLNTAGGNPVRVRTSPSVPAEGDGVTLFGGAGGDGALIVRAVEERHSGA